MKRRIITISDNGIITVPSETRMSISEIADLFDIYYQTVKQQIHSIRKSGVADGDYLMSCTCDGSKVYPDYYGLEMIIAVSFRVRSVKAEIFRQWIMKKALRIYTTATLVLPLQNTLLN